MHVLTIGKDLSTVSPCPILGEYIGMLPNVENLCAKLSSDCVSQDTMYYMVSDCSQLQIYEGKLTRVFVIKVLYVVRSMLPNSPYGRVASSTLFRGVGV